MAHLTHEEWVGLVLGSQGTVRLVMLEVTLTMTKDCYASDYNSDVEKTMFWLS